jgi:hypothetical protein
MFQSFRSINSIYQNWFNKSTSNPAVKCKEIRYSYSSWFSKLPKLFFLFNEHMFSFLTLQITFEIYCRLCSLIFQHIIFSCSVWSHINWEKSKFLSSLLARGKINIRRRCNVINKLEKIGCVWKWIYCHLLSATR